ncbi:MAG: endonuclease/exonuclease/phosphatase family protein [Bacteroidia bacterium]|nr:endonuclease/exonuclease/phosphatase family protein [Bacteroidia bacterium]
MKKLSGFNKIVFLVNSIVAAMLLLSYILPFIAPKTFPFLSILSLAVPILILLNILFLIYWLLKARKQFLLSTVILIIGYNYVGSLYKFSSGENMEIKDSFSVMNYNVRLFNLYEWIEEENVEKKIEGLIKTEQPDILNIQEYHPHRNINFSNFKYKFEKLEGNKTKYGQAIFSNFPIINSGSIEFPQTANNAIYADIVKDDDTIRIYNIHLQSLQINTDVDKLSNEDSQRILKRVSSTFAMQQNQAELFVHHLNKCPYKSIISGDFNNTAYSYVYKQIKGDFQDTFEVAGSGFGRTFDFRFFPIRIDFILADNSFNINGFINYSEKLSDHYPIMTKMSLKK